MKKRAIGTILIGTILLAGCVKTQSSVISFDTFSTTIKSPYVYQQTKITTNTPEIQKIYTSTNSGAQWSIIIASEATIWEDSASFANNNIETLKSNLEWKGIITDTKNLTLSCGDDDIEASISTIEVQKETENENIIRYVTQMYFVYQNKGYTVSHLTQNKDEVKWVQKGFTKIKHNTCIKNLLINSSPLIVISFTFALSL